MSPLSLALINEEIDFWEQNFFEICILKKIPAVIPDNFSIKTLLVKFMSDEDYHAIAHRLAVLKKNREAWFYLQNI